MLVKILDFIFIAIGIIFVNAFWIGAIIGVRYLYRRFIKGEKHEQTEQEKKTNKKIGIVFLLMLIYYFVYSAITW